MNHVLSQVQYVPAIFWWPSSSITATAPVAFRSPCHRPPVAPECPWALTMSKGDVVGSQELMETLHSIHWDMIDMLKSWFLTHHDWFVVDLALWKIWKSVAMMTFPIYGKIKNVPKHQPDECMYNILLKENSSCSNNPLGCPWKCHKKKLAYDSWFILSSIPAELIPRFIFVDSTPARCFRAWSGVTVLNMRLNLGLRQRVMDGKIGPKTCIVPLKLGIDPSKKWYHHQKVEFSHP